MSYYLSLVNIFALYSLIFLSKMEVKYKILSDFLIDNRDDKPTFYEFVKQKFELNDNSVQLYKNQFDQFIKTHNRLCRPKHFAKQYASWLENKFTLKNPSAGQKLLKPFEK